MRNKTPELPSQQQALPDHEHAIVVNDVHAVNQNPINAPLTGHLKAAMFGLGCFWGAERKFWQLEGVYTTSVGYSAGFTKNARYEEVCSGMTAHNEVVRVIYDSSVIDFDALLTVFWSSHNPTQGYQQGNDQGTQYRSGIYCYNDEQLKAAKASQLHYQKKLDEAGHAQITTEITPVSEFYFAEDYHQQYLHKNPSGYCGLGGLNIPS